jgi:hypothetical protein
MSGYDRFIDTLRRLTTAPPQPEMPKPGSQWEAWAEYRLCQLETWQTWIVRLLIGSLAVQVGLKLLDLLK